MTRRSKFTVGVAAFALVAVAMAANAQTRGIFQRISTEFIAGGYTRIGAPYTGWLDDGESTRFTVWLAAGQRYAIAGACDRDCDDVDLEILDPRGEVIDSDFDLDDQPVVHAFPPRSGRHEVVVSMADCAIEPCEYVAGVFRE